MSVGKQWKPIHWKISEALQHRPEALRVVVDKSTFTELRRELLLMEPISEIYVYGSPVVEAAPDDIILEALKPNGIGILSNDD